MTIAQVAIDVPVPTLFDYRMDEASADDVGVRVQVPLGRRQVVGIVMALATESNVPRAKLRSVSKVLRDVPALPDEILALVRFCSDYYHHPLGEAALTVLPTRLRSAKPVRARHAPDYWPTAAGMAEVAKGLPKRSIALRRLWERCAELGHLPAPVCANLEPALRRSLKILLDRGWLEPRISAPSGQPASQVVAPGPALTAEQRAAILAMTEGAGYRAWMLHGITGSGKTEVYFHLVASALEDHGQVLLLVPEINLTPQFEARIRARFPFTPLVSLNSGLAGGERAANWLAAQAGEARIVLGTRSAVFVPLPRLKLIVVDEEHDSSFKQIEGMRYHARDLAVWRAHARGIPIVLGSATPSLETYQHALSGRYRTARLAQRANAAELPRIHLVATRGRKLPDGIAPEIVDALRDRLARQEQCLVFINRRGYAPTLLCHACHWVAACHRCSARLVLHAARRRLVCHHCGHTEPVASSCPDCGNVDLRPLGHGTQRIEAVLRGALPQARVLRVDRDSTGGRNAWSDMRESIERQEVDILVGTQLMAKGHDFPGLSLVCVLDADRSLYSTDFRASERLFAQLMQVSGRAGRGTAAGHVLVQTEFPEHPLYHSLRDHDFTGYAASLLDERRSAGFPPFVHQAVLRAEATLAERVFEFLQGAAAAARDIAGEVLVFDPAPSLMHRLKGQERGQLLVQSDSRPRLHHFLDRWLALLRTGRSSDIRWTVDVDPLDV
jgi:primosomal protein N' (replication factor Y)